MTRPRPLCRALAPRSVLAALMVLVLVLGSLTHALARHAAPGAQVLVICTGAGLVRITLDAEGQPVEQPLPCPDCILTLAPPPATAAPALPPRAQAVTGLPVQTRHVRAPTRLWPPSRAPPHPV